MRFCPFAHSGFYKPLTDLLATAPSCLALAEILNMMPAQDVHEYYHETQSIDDGKFQGIERGYAIVILGPAVTAMHLFWGSHEFTQVVNFGRRGLHAIILRGLHQASP